jgi:myo-inositol-1(or 4)-monophosphatase
VTVTGTELDALADLAARLAVAAGDAALAGQRSDTVTSRTKSTATDLVTAFDRAAEATLVAGIVAARPHDAIVGEEGTDRPGTSGVSWYLDPIDGTTNFVYDLPLWSTSVAAGDADGMAVAAVYAPAMGELFAARRGGGATLGGHPIRCSDRDELALALLATGFSYDAGRRRVQADVVARLIGAVRDIRRLGSAALDLCYVAAGRYDAYFETGLNSWDAAAGELIAREAGCRTGDLHGGPARPAELLAATPAIFDDLRAHIVAASADP